MENKVQKFIIGLIILLVIAFIGLVYYIMIEFYSEEKSNIEAPLSEQFYEVYEPLNLKKYSVDIASSTLNQELKKNFTKNLILSYNLDKFVNINKEKKIEEQYPTIVDNIINCTIYDRSIENLETVGNIQTYKNIEYTLAISRKSFNEIAKELMNIDLNAPISITEENKLYKRIKYNKAADKYYINTGNADVGEQPSLIYSLKNIKKVNDWYEAEIYAYNIVEETDNNTEYTLASILEGNDTDLLDKAYKYNKNMIYQFMKVQFKENETGKHVKYTFNYLNKYQPLFEGEITTILTNISQENNQYYVELPANIAIIDNQYNIKYIDKNTKVKLLTDKKYDLEKTNSYEIRGNFAQINNEMIFKISN